MQNKLISVMLVIVIGVSLLPVVGSMTETYNITSTQESFTATSDNATAETFTVTNTIDSINEVTVNGSVLDSATYSYTGTDVTLDASVSNIDDTIVIDYDYQFETSTAVDSLINLLPILFVVIIVGGAVAYVKFK